MALYSETLTIKSSLIGSYSITRVGDTKIERSIQVPAAKAGSIASEADGAAVITLDANHGITTQVKVGVFWEGGQRD